VPAEPLKPQNPFSTRCVRPDAFPYLFPSETAPADLLDRYRAMAWRGEIVGPHGSGKSCLVQALIPLLENAGRRILRYPVGAGPAAEASRSWPAGPLTPATHVIIDGYEQLSPFRQARWRWTTWRIGAGLLVTSHRSVGLPRLWTTTTSVELAERIVRQLLRPYSDAAVSRAEIESAFARHQGNLREVLMDLYDVYEARQALPS
jgi:hypothetical protein